MLIEEFTKLTGYKPSVEEYAKIEKQYSVSDASKQEFCAIWNLNKVLEKFPHWVADDIAQGLNFVLTELYENGFKDTKHYRKLRNIFLNIDY